MTLKPVYHHPDNSIGHRLIWWGGCDVDLQSNASQDHIA